MPIDIEWEDGSANINILCDGCDKEYLIITDDISGLEYFIYLIIFIILALTEFTFQVLIFIKMKKIFRNHKKILF